MAELSAEEIAQRAFELELLDDKSLREVRGEITGRHVESAEFQQLLLRRGLMTPYQMERLLRGDRTGFFYGRYKILYQVGAGTFARVYRSVHQESGQIFGVKVLRQRFVADPKKCEQFRQEAEVGLTLRHNNIVGIHEVGAERANQYIVMEFVEGQSLREFLKVRRRLELIDAVRLMSDIMRGLDYAAKRGISHRDMKSSNVLVSSSGTAKLVDFGLAGVDPESSDEALAGIENPRTLDYMALERASGMVNGDIKSDVYFAGCIFYQMLSGYPALEETRDRILRANKSRFLEVVPLKKYCPDMPGPVLAIAERAMELDPRQRYQMPGEMLADLLAVQKRLEEGNDLSSLNSLTLNSKQRTLMLVESNAKLQDVLRDQLKKNGFRVLVTADPQRPMQWTPGNQTAAECVLFSTGTLGESALQAFNDFGANTITSKIPAVLLLAAKHQDWAAQAKLAAHRVVINSPIKVPELIETLSRLLAAPAATTTA